MLYFKLHPSRWECQSDSKTIFRAIEFSNGGYIVSFKLHDNTVIDFHYTDSEVTENFAEGYWILATEEEYIGKGDF